MTQNLENINIENSHPIPTPQEIHDALPITESSREITSRTRDSIFNILKGEDHRMFMVVGPCSIHSYEDALEYAEKIKQLAPKVSDSLVLVMRVYFEKPRTTVGWKGLINDPHLDGTFQVEKGLKLARKLLLEINEMGVPTGSEALDPITPQYFGDLVSWYAIGARTVESQTHREMASGLSSPVGIKNGTDGGSAVVINALTSCQNPHHFLGINTGGQVSVLQTRGNRGAHSILRGGGGRPNYDSVSVALFEQELSKANLPQNIVIDCSHGNSFKDYEKQPLVLRDCVSQVKDGNRSIVGFMLESNLAAGRQDIPDDIKQLRKGVSVTDSCIDWETTEQIILEAHSQLKGFLPKRNRSN